MSWSMQAANDAVSVLILRKGFDAVWDEIDQETRGEIILEVKQAIMDAFMGRAE